MKIICTRKEKEWLVDSLMTSEEPCRFEKIGSYENCKNCRECLDKNIEWEIKGVNMSEIRVTETERH